MEEIILWLQLVFPECLTLTDSHCLPFFHPTGRLSLASG